MTNGASYLLPSGDAPLAELHSWMSLTQQICIEQTIPTPSLLKDHYTRINDFLLLKTFLIGESLSLADACLFDAAMTHGCCFEHGNITRYLRHGKQLYLS